MSRTARFRARAVILDLDGTLLDTAADLAAAVNRMLAEWGRPELPEAQVAAYIGKGAEVLIHRALGGGLDARVDAVLHHRGLEAFLRHYALENGRQARLYPEVIEGLQAMREQGLRLACVTNKPQAYADPLLERCGLRGFFECVLGGDALPARKPDPMPLQQVAIDFGLPCAECVAIGDSVNDALAARAAGMAVLAVPYGYNEGRPVESLDVDGIVETLLEAALRIDPIRPVG